MRNITVGPFRPWLIPETAVERAALAEKPHDTDAHPCWCGRCQRNRHRGLRLSISTPIPSGAGSMTDPEGYGPSAGHLCDPSGNRDGRWLAQPVGGIWHDDRTGSRSRKDFLR